MKSLFDRYVLMYMNNIMICSLSMILQWKGISTSVRNRCLARNQILFQWLSLEHSTTGVGYWPIVKLFMYMIPFSVTVQTLCSITITLMLWSLWCILQLTLMKFSHLQYTLWFNSLLCTGYSTLFVKKIDLLIVNWCHVGWGILYRLLIIVCFVDSVMI